MSNMFNIVEIDNKELAVVLKQDQLSEAVAGKENASFKRFGNLAKKSGEEVVFTSLHKPFILDHLEFATSALNDVQFRIYLGNGGSADQRLNLLRNDGVTVDPLTARNISDRPSPLFQVPWFDKNYNTYKFTLAKPIVCPQGLVVAVLNTSADTDYRAGVVGFGRYI